MIHGKDPRKDKPGVLPNVSGTLAVLFGAELLLFVVTLLSAVSLGLRGRPHASLLALSGVFFLCALTSFPVVIGRGLWTGIKRIVCLAAMAVALGQAFVAVRDMSASGRAFKEDELRLTREIRDLEFDLDYRDASKGSEARRGLEARRDALLRDRARLEDFRTRTVKAVAVVIGGAALLFVLNILMFFESSRLHAGRRERP